MPLKAADVGGLEVTNVVDGVGGVIGFTRSLNKMYKEQFEKSVQELMAYENERKRGKIGCIIYDVFMYFAQSVADQFMIPGICLRTSCAASILGITATHTPQERGFNMPVHVPIESLVQVPELKALELGKVAEHLNELNAAVATAFNKSIAIIVNTMGFLEWAAINKAQEYFKATVYPIGPFHLYAENTNKSNSLLNEDPTCIAWLNQHPPRSVLYVSFGSLASMSEKDLLETATGLVQSNQPFLWVIRPKMVIGGRCWAEILPRDLIERIEETGLVVSWAPQRQVLGHGSIGGFWTHCGWNSTIEGVCEGVPMICKPFFGDQFWNAKYITKVWKIGIEIENEIERVNVERIIKELMVGEKGKEMRKRAMDLKDKVELCYKDGGTSYKYVDQLVELIASF
ncbi:UDP-glycosyltransferase 76E4-like [Chenopodium quinoa]|uniref:UDP-glycosyltransferase 76E4-like n=1 Tax=Chenopodium quinoa TaxID=63459 RepID=UPI000B7995EB|nr:UDP-glycosyltransferase 76E4-like [Chenopodium quinoa]